MWLLVLAYLGGVLTIVSPCILPVLPFVFARTGQPFFADVDQVLVESPTQVRFTFKSADNRTLPLDLASLPVLPEHWWQGRNFANGGGFEPPVGSGPYRISSVDNGRSVTFERVKDWWGRDLPVTRKCRGELHAYLSVAR